MRTRKDELIDKLIEYFTQHGVADVSLRPMAAEVGTSARLLIFHFRSKEQLLAEVLSEMQRRLQASLLELVPVPGSRAGARRASPLRKFWRWATDDAHLPSLRLLYHLQMLAILNPDTYGGLLTAQSTDWIDLIKRYLPSAQRSATTATLFVAVFDGLFLELLSTGDRRRTTRALERFIRMGRMEGKGIRRAHA
ncbi:MAG: TetR/AcrR family transcriptional regulator [bacterium]